MNKETQIQAQIEALRAMRRELNARLKQELAAIDRRIRQLSGRTGSARHRSGSGRYPGDSPAPGERVSH